MTAERADAILAVMDALWPDFSAEGFDDGLDWLLSILKGLRVTDDEIDAVLEGPSLACRAVA
jgi:hypothetical protein